MFCRQLPEYLQHVRRRIEQQRGNLITEQTTRNVRNLFTDLIIIMKERCTGDNSVVPSALVTGRQLEFAREFACEDGEFSSLLELRRSMAALGVGLTTTSPVVTAEF